MNLIELIREHQLEAMLVLCGACAILIFLLLNTRFLSKRRKWILIMMELEAVLLLWFDRLAYVYAGDLSPAGFIWIRVSNFMVFFLTSVILFTYNQYLIDLLKNESRLTAVPKRLTITSFAALLGMLLAVIAAFTGLYYYFDETNHYQRGPGFLIAYIIPVFYPILQFTVIRQYKKCFSKLIYLSLILYIFVPIGCGILQIFTYGISIVNMSMVAVSISLYIFMYLDMNNEVEHAHKIEIENMQGEQERMHRLFDQTATAFVSAVEKKDDFTKGNSLAIAELSRKIAGIAGKTPEECEEVYYAALLHDVGLIGIPDAVIKNNEDPDKYDYETMHKKPEIGAEILSSITEHPYLSRCAHYSHERYNGTGYPEGLKGEEIPEIARIIAVADAYVTMTTKKRYRDARPDFMVREAFVKGAGEEFDPAFAKIMLKIIDDSSAKRTQENKPVLETELTCRAYREAVSTGIPVEREKVRITFTCEGPIDPKMPFSMPSIVLFDAYDQRVHTDKKTIKGYHYLEYGEIWFDKHSITTEARKIEEIKLEESGSSLPNTQFEILAGRYEDHLRLILRSSTYQKEVTVALPSATNSSYIGLTGENCELKNIEARPTGLMTGADEIGRIVESVSYIDHLESDLKNVQVDRTRSAYTEGVELRHHLHLSFHTMSLPGASLVWHCPYIVVYSAKDGQVNGEDYREYAEIKLNGESNVPGEFATNRFVMKKKEGFTGWDDWKVKNQKGMECEVFLDKKGNRITLKTENMGIMIESITTLKAEAEHIYVAVTGDQVALTDIRIDY